MAYIAFFGFSAALFPIYISNYIYLNSEQKYANLNVVIFGKIRLYNINTVKNSPDKLEMNGKSTEIDVGNIRRGALRIFKRIYLVKLIQMADYGLKNEANAYAAAVQYTSAGVLNLLFKACGKTARLKNYVILNHEHSAVVYYAKAVTVINLLTVASLFMIILWEKFNEFKNKKEQRKRF